MSVKFRIDGKFAVVSARGVSTIEEVRSTFDGIPTTDALHLPIKILFDARYTQYAPPAE